ncbi:MAG: hypothetical protein HYX48_05520 [Chlamydiales bacterium]|nr:hypothetical protein [Chlamydiales bacterium]
MTNTINFGKINLGTDKLFELVVTVEGAGEVDLEKIKTAAIRHFTAMATSHISRRSQAPSLADAQFSKIGAQFGSTPPEAHNDQERTDWEEFERLILQTASHSSRSQRASVSSQTSPRRAPTVEVLSGDDLSDAEEPVRSASAAAASGSGSPAAQPTALARATLKPLSDRVSQAAHSMSTETRRWERFKGYYSQIQTPAQLEALIQRLGQHEDAAVLKWVHGVYKKKRGADLRKMLDIHIAHREAQNAENQRKNKKFTN